MSDKWQWYGADHEKLGPSWEVESEAKKYGDRRMEESQASDDPADASWKSYRVALCYEPDADAPYEVKELPTLGADHETITIDVTPEEHARFEAFARLYQMSIADAVRYALARQDLWECVSLEVRPYSEATGYVTCDERGAANLWVTSVPCVMEERAPANTQFGARVRELRLGTGLSLRAFCLKHGVNRGNWSQMETGRRRPPATEERVIEIGRLLGLAADGVAMQQLITLARQ